MSGESEYELIHKVNQIRGLFAKAWNFSTNQMPWNSVEQAIANEAWEFP